MNLTEITQRPATKPRPPIWTPFPSSPQAMAYNSPADELFFGGGAGGGKTDLVLGLAGTHHRNSLIMRREFPQTRSMIERSREIYNRDGANHARDSYNESLHIWRLTDGRQIEFGSLQYEKDKGKYQGRAHDLKAWDELPQFSEAMFRFVNAWNRTSNPRQRCRIIGTGNPPLRIEEEWVIHYWAPWLNDQHSNPAKAGELRWFAILDGKDAEVESGKHFEYKGETIRPKSRTFIPALVTDNPVLMAAGYQATIDATPEPLRSALKGNWRAARQDDVWQVIPTEWVRLAQKRWRERPPPKTPITSAGVDVARGGKDKTVIAVRRGNWFDVLHKHPGKATPSGSEAAGLVLGVVPPGTVTNVDVIGVGSSVYDHLLPHNDQTRAINFSEASPARDRAGKLGFVNLRAEAYWKMREALDPDYGEEIALPDDPELLSDLCAPRWSLAVRGIQIESKEDVIERIGRSPDCGDAVVLALLNTQGGIGGSGVYL